MLLIAGAGAVLVMLDLSTLINLFALAAIVVAAALTPAARGDGAAPGEGAWWSMLMLGAVFCLIGVPVEIGLEGVGGMLTLAGGVLVVLGATLGFPVRARPD